MASKIGAGFGAALIGLGVLFVFLGAFIEGMWWFLIGLFLRNAAKSSFVQLQIRDALKGEPISRFMNPNPIIVPADISLQDLVRDYVYAHHFHMFPVARGSEILGCISTKEIKGVPKEEWGRHSVQEVLAPCSEDNMVTPNTDAVDVLSILQRTGSSRLLVMDQERLAGVVSLKDLLKFLSLKLDLEGDGAGSFLSSRRPMSSDE